MRRRTLFAIVLAGAAALDLGIGLVSCSDPPRDQDVAVLAAHAVPLDLDKPYTADDYRFLDAAVGSASVVQLGESLHITAEFPRARLRVVQYLHEQLGFDTLALEGSLTQAWLAEELLARSHDPNRIARAQETAWFMLWRTPAMRELMAYVDQTRATPHPLYLTSFDVQIGTSAAYQMDPKIVTDLVDALRAYGPPPDPAHEQQMRSGLAKVVGCAHATDLVGLAADGSYAAADLDAWIQSILPRVAPGPHATALAMIPDNFRDNIALCVRSAGSMASWQRTRDEINADNVVALRDRVSQSHKILVWAHHSHVHYNFTGDHVPSMGQHLHDRLGGATYTLGLFAGDGRVYDGSVFGQRSLPSVRKVGVERMLAAVDRDAYFVDVSRLPIDDPHAGWLVPQRSRFETLSPRPIVLAKDFDGAIFVAHVHPSPFTDSVVARALLCSWGFLVQHWPGTAVLLLFGLGALFLATVRWFYRRLHGLLARGRGAAT